MNSNEQNSLSRKEFLEFMGRGALGLASMTFMGGMLASCAGLRKKGTGFSLQAIAPSSKDELLLADGLNYSILLKHGDALNKTEYFGDCNDFTAFIPLVSSNPNDGLLWVNHEFLLPLFVSGHRIQKNEKRKKADVLREQLEVGGTIVRLRRDANGQWKPVLDDSYNKRITARTRIPFAWDRPIAGANEAIGTMGNCAGGVTPWGTILTCEEQHLEFYGDRDYGFDGTPSGRLTDSCIYGWETVFDYPPEHYGWTVEVNPRTGSAKKLVALGRFGKEGATVSTAKDGRCVVYSGDDDIDRCIYKFVAAQKGSLEQGILYVANLGQGRWIPLVWETNPVLRRVFKDQTDVLVRARLAGLLVGGSQLDRPEDIEVDPYSKAVFITLTNNRNKGNDFGSILKIIEKNNDPLSTEFEASTFLTGGPSTGFACPDNLAFDKKGNLWFTSDISPTWVNTGVHAPFRNNGLFVVPMRDKNAGQVIQVASAPIEAEFTGPSFSPDGKTLFLSVQHPGEASESLQAPNSHWPHGGNSIPKSSVVAIQGTALDRLISS